jgi:Spy/CpxP family protein refolding chaperone
MTTKILILACFCVAFAAGVMVGLYNSPRVSGNLASPSAPTTGPSTRPARHRGGFLASELSLTSEQQAQMDKIWSETARRGGHDREERGQYRKERDDAIVALIRPDDKAAYQQVLDTYQKKMEALDAQRRSAFESAVKQTKELLSPEQLVKYEAILKRNQWEGGPQRGGSDRGGPERGGDRSQTPNFDHSRRTGDRATTQASSDR